MQSCSLAERLHKKGMQAGGAEVRLTRCQDGRRADILELTLRAGACSMRRLRKSYEL